MVHQGASLQTVRELKALPYHQAIPISEQLPVILEGSQPEIPLFYPGEPGCDVPSSIWDDHYPPSFSPSVEGHHEPFSCGLSILQPQGHCPAGASPLGRVLGLAISPSCFLAPFSKDKESKPALFGAGLRS